MKGLTLFKMMTIIVIVIDLDKEINFKTKILQH